MTLTLAQQIEQYLSNGGFFNPEQMEHDKVCDLLLRCREALVASHEQAQRWQPIETAPKDGTRIICWGPNLKVAECEWRYEAKRGFSEMRGWFRSNQCPEVQPTHWMPLPPPPAAVEADAPFLPPIDLADEILHLKMARTVQADRLRALESKWRGQASDSMLESSRIHSVVHVTTGAEERCIARSGTWKACADELAAILAPETETR